MPRPRARLALAVCLCFGSTSSALRVTRRWLGAAAAASVCPPVEAAEQTMPTVFVAGATGRTGREVVQALRASGAYRVISGVRSDTVAKIQRDAGFEAFAVDVTEEGAAREIAAELKRTAARDVVCTVGFVPTYLYEDDKRAAFRIDYEGTVALIRAAEEAALPGRFVLVSSLLATLPEENASSRGLNMLGGVSAASSRVRGLRRVQPREPRHSRPMLTNPAWSPSTPRAGGMCPFLFLAHKPPRRAGARPPRPAQVLDQKKAAEAALRASPLDWSIVRPGVLAPKQQGATL
eukprot:3231231-Prymnesium_polylepis.1